MELPQNDEFDRWCYTEEDPRVMLEDGRPVPLLTTVLHRVCANDPRRFAEAVRALQIAFSAGQSSGRSGS